MGMNLASPARKAHQTGQPTTARAGYLGPSLDTRPTEYFNGAAVLRARPESQGVVDKCCASDRNKGNSGLAALLVVVDCLLA